jgi:branched-chain amino acid transport system substrate-binding protein
VVTANGGTFVGEDYFPLDHRDYRETIANIISRSAEAVFNTIVPPGVTPFLEQLHACTSYDENFLNTVQPSSRAPALAQAFTEVLNE